MDLNLRGRLALVTGSTRGLGRAIAEALALEGTNIIINGRNKKIVEKVRSEIRLKYGIFTYGCVADVTDTKEINKYFEQIHKPHHDKLDILVNNVGNIGKFESFMELTDEDWLQCYNLTFMSAVRLTRGALPFLKASGDGRIINISSIISHQPGSFPQYSSAKAALNNFTKYLANTLGKENIVVNGVCPGSLKSGAWKQIVEDRAKRRGLSVDESEKIMESDESKKSPLGRMAELKNIADMVVYLASEKSNFITGEIINVDGGITRGI
jgi:3-oxoacyl-[acyl-carrier protein] reductase